MDLIARNIDDLTPQWFTTVLQDGGAAGPATTVAHADTRVIGTGQMGMVTRTRLTYQPGNDGPASVIVKLPSTDAGSRQLGVAAGIYEAEVRFYQEIAPTVDIGMPALYWADLEAASGRFTLVLEDLGADAEVGDMIAGASSTQIDVAFEALIGLQAPRWNDPDLAATPWIADLARTEMLFGTVAAAVAPFEARFADRLEPRHVELIRQIAPHATAVAQLIWQPPLVICHGDYRLDNMLFGQDGAERPLTVVDWQTVTWGPAMTDVAYFLGCALPAEARREHAEALLRSYHDGLGPDAVLTLDDVREGVRRQSFFGVVMAIVSPMLVERTERGDRMFMTMIARHCQHVLDTGALDVLPKSETLKPLQPNATDEDIHPPTDEVLWNESWYFDFADPGQDVGGWVRLGLIPHQGHAWINALLCGPDMPTIAVVDFEAPLPADHTRVHTDDVDLELDAVDPLTTYRVALRGRGQAYDDPAALLRGESGRPVALQMDLTWTTAGTPYQYRLSTRYEIPCVVSGSVTADGRTYEFADVAGQRDHSWAARDWWSMEWVWSALHLDDGTHVHGLDLRIPGVPRMAAGYVQRDGEVVELQTVVARETFGDDHLPLGTTLEISPGDITATIDVRGHAPVLLTSNDGRVSRFPRAWATVTTADGRTGVGWLEWNRNQST